METTTQTKILTIKKVNFTGKWVEFWFEEDTPSAIDGEDGWQLYAKSYMLENAAEQAGMSEQVKNTGYAGKKIEFEYVAPNWEIKRMIPMDESATDSKEDITANTWQQVSDLSELDRGLIVRNKGNRTVTYVVNSNFGTRVTAMTSADITNPTEWEVYELNSNYKEIQA